MQPSEDKKADGGIQSHQNIQVEQEYLVKNSSSQKIETADEKSIITADKTHGRRCEESDVPMSVIETIPLTVVEVVYVKEEPNGGSECSSPHDGGMLGIEDVQVNTKLKLDKKNSLDVPSLQANKKRSGFREKNYLKVDGLYNCDYCSFTTPNKKKLRQHYNCFHKNLHDCLHCDFVTADPSELECHLDTHHDRSASGCPFCPFNSVDKQQLQEHIASHQKNISRVCPHCPFVAISAKQYNVHVRFHFSADTLKCSHCLYLTNSRSALTIHMKRHNGSGILSCHSCSFKTIYSSCMKLHEKKHSGDNWEKCMYCNFETPRKSDLVYHMAKHTKENLLTCNLCGFKTPYKQNMDYHVSVHTRKGFLKCQLCNYSTLKKLYLDAHIKSKHTREGLLKCTKCDFKSAYKHHLKNHMSGHFTEGHLTCPVCNVFSDANDNKFLYHLNVDHSDVKSLNCQQCSLVTKSKGVMLRHLRLHKGQQAVEPLFRSNHQKRPYLRVNDVPMIETVEEPSVGKVVEDDDVIAVEHDDPPVERETKVELEGI